jgi:hypothetical protein
MRAFQTKRFSWAALLALAACGDLSDHANALGEQEHDLVQYATPPSTLSPNPLTLTRGSSGIFGTVVSNDVANTRGPWTVFGAVVQGGRPLGTSAWTFTPDPNPPGSQRSATLTLAPNTVEEQILSSGSKIVLAVQYQNVARLDFLTVGF